MKTYRVARMPHVVKQMRDLAKRAASLGINSTAHLDTNRQDFVDSPAEQ